MSIIRAAMPVLARHEGDWIGTYTTVDNEGNVIETYQSHLTCEFPNAAQYPYLQTNRYTWPDGKVQKYQFPGSYRNKKLWFDTERITGHAWEADNSIVILYFKYKDIPDAYVYEMIHLSDCNNYRARTWHWFKEQQIYQRTLIQEERQQ